jgi:hypothetical protein
MNPKLLTREWNEEFKQKLKNRNLLTVQNRRKRVDVELSRRVENSTKRPADMHEHTYWIHTPDKLEKIKHSTVVTPWTDEELSRNRHLPRYVKEAYKKQFLEWKKQNKIKCDNLAKKEELLRQHKFKMFSVKNERAKYVKIFRS